MSLRSTPTLVTPSSEAWSSPLWQHQQHVSQCSWSVNMEGRLVDGSEDTLTNARHTQHMRHVVLPLWHQHGGHLCHGLLVLGMGLWVLGWPSSGSLRWGHEGGVRCRFWRHELWSRHAPSLALRLPIASILRVVDLFPYLAELVLSIVSSQVVLQLVPSREVFATDATHEWLLSCVHTAVALEVWCTGKVHLAELTLKGTLASVETDVVAQSRLTLELLRGMNRQGSTKGWLIRSWCNN